MDRLLPALIILIVVAAIFTGLALGWRARRRRQADIPTPAAPPAESGEVRASADLLYVATTRADAPTDRHDDTGAMVRNHELYEKGICLYALSRC